MEDSCQLSVVSCRNAARTRLRLATSQDIEKARFVLGRKSNGIDTLRGSLQSIRENGLTGLSKFFSPNTLHFRLCNLLYCKTLF
jgi:hypothetical protein